MNKLLFVVLFAFFFVVGCASVPADHPSPIPATPRAVQPPSSGSTAGLSEDARETIYVSVLRDEKLLGRNFLTGDDAITMGKVICDEFDFGATRMDIWGMLLDDGFTPRDAGFLTGTATAAFCPKYNGRLG